MNFKIFLFYITISVFIINYGSELDAKNSGRIRIYLNPSEKTQSKITKIAVFPFNANAARQYETQGSAFADLYTEDFREIGYNCIDREIISKKMKEQSLNPHLYVDLNTAIRIGKLLDADGVVLGEVIRTLSIFTSDWRYLIKLVDVETGQTVWTVHALNVFKGEIAHRLKEELYKKNK